MNKRWEIWYLVAHLTLEVKHRQSGEMMVSCRTYRSSEHRMRLGRLLVLSLEMGFYNS